MTDNPGQDLRAAFFDGDLPMVANGDREDAKRAQRWRQWRACQNCGARCIGWPCGICGSNR